MYQIAGLYNKRNTVTLVDTMENPIIDEKDILEVWKSNVEELFKDDRRRTSNFKVGGSSCHKNG